MPRFTVLAPTLAVLTVLLFAGPTLSAVRIGTPRNETLAGTTDNDQLTGLEGSDVLKGKAGNDVYFFDDNFSLDADLSVGHDTLIEKAGEGTDTVNFRAVTPGNIHVRLIPEWANVGGLFNGAAGPSGEVRFAYQANGQLVQSVVENAVGGKGDGDTIVGGGGKNVIQPGGGAADVLGDLGGYGDGPGGNPEIPASNDVYKGFADNTGTDEIQDTGGNGDVLDMRPLSIRDVSVTAVDLDKTGIAESLQIVTSATSQVVVAGQFGDYFDQEAQTNFHGQIETIKFADATFRTPSALRNLATVSAEATSEKQAQLAKVAEGLAKEARALVDTNDPLGLNEIAGGRVAESGLDTPRADQPEKKDTHAKHETKRTHKESKHAATHAHRNQR